MPALKRKHSSIYCPTSSNGSIGSVPPTKRVKLDDDAILPSCPAVPLESPEQMKKMTAAAASKRKHSSNDCPPATSTKRVKLDDDVIPTNSCPFVPVEQTNPSRRINIVPLSDEDFEKRFRKIESLGSGGFGEAYRAYDRQTRNRVVVKRFDVKEVFNWVDDLPTEIHLVSSMSHKNICPMLEAFRSKDYFRMTMPDINGVDLVQYLGRKTGRRVKDLEPQIHYIANEVAQGLRYLHDDCSVVHLDIKPKNVIISDKGGECKVQIIDFGFAKRYSKGVKEFHVDSGTDLPTYRCGRGTTGLESFHLHLNTFIPGKDIYNIWPFQI